MSKKMLLCQVNSNLRWAFQEYENNGACALELFNKANKVLRTIRYFWMRFNLPFISIWLSKEWVERIKDAETIIIQMSYLTMNLPKFINKRNPDARVIAWYWDIVKERTQPKDIKGKCELWSFDPADCKKYGMRYNHQYYFKTLIKKSECCKWDVFFCGSDCGRGKMLTDLYRKMLELNLKVNFKIVYPQDKNIPLETVSKLLNYEEIRECNLNSKAILEIPRPGQSGATLRLMEALFLNKKVITNNPNVKEEPFYREKNIFILGERSIDDLKSFVDSDYDHSSDEYIDKYDFNSWLRNFDS
ncbi:hypothetical protein IKQ19_07515 [Candidatus Saccharibacteria bacterium]|nr:hypothetical protein [Candidatus Saccharibacteria bacterium]